MTTNIDRLVQQAKDSLAMVDNARDSLDSRAQQLIQAAGLIMVLVSAIRLPAALDGQTSLGRISFAVAFAVFIGMVSLALRVWWPTTFGTPGPDLSQVDLVYSNYIEADDKDSGLQIWADYQGTIDVLVAVNERKARYLKGAMALFLVQIIGLLFMALLG